MHYQAHGSTTTTKSYPSISILLRH